MRKLQKRLRLSRETVRELRRLEGAELGRDALQEVAGGYHSQNGPRSCLLSCPRQC
jgi:hypothetical protein